MISKKRQGIDVLPQTGYDLNIELERYDQRLPESVRDKFPYIRDYEAFKVPTALDPKTILRTNWLLLSLMKLILWHFPLKSYNPVLWGVPKGSYATNPNGPCRIMEFWKMVQALNCLGLRVVLDVVYNHLHGSGPIADNSMLDKNITCVNNTASEHFMVNHLIVDDLLNRACNYKTRAKSLLRNLSRDKDEVDGSSIFMYGEGWDFGEVANNGRGINASQFNLAGSGIGSFNDRIRDALLGGYPFGHPLQQGFLTGLSLQ
ncbi:Glycoside hydrolase, catalytic domain-containing protein, partial [Cynara cardunculus var. scolymus]